MKKVKIYSTPECPYCKMAKEYLKKKKIEFEDFDVSKDEKAREEMIEKTGSGSVPVIEIDGEIIVGFDEEKLDELLK